MTPQAESQREIRDYLLGGLPQDAQRRVEERLLTEEAFMDELTLAEEELIDDYVGERLSARERADFERHFLSTEERRRQLRFARALGRYADAAHATKSGAPSAARAPEATGGFGARLRAFWAGLSFAPRAGLALAAVAVVVFALWLARPARPRSFYALALSASAGDRAAGAQGVPVRLPPDAEALRLTLSLPEGAGASGGYRAELLSEGGRPERAAVAAHDARTVTVVVPAAALARGRYAVRLFESAPQGGERRVPGSYFFDVE